MTKSNFAKGTALSGSLEALGLDPAKFEVFNRLAKLTGVQNCCASIHVPRCIYILFNHVLFKQKHTCSCV